MSSSPPAWRRYLSFWGARVADDFDDEVRFHLEMRIEDFKRLGLSDDEARARATQRIGDIARVRGRCVSIASRREQRMARARTIEAFAQDVRYGVRQLRRNIGWTAVATITLALGIGATTAVFSVVNSLILHPLPCRDADRVANVMMADPKSHISVSPNAMLVRGWRQGAKTLEGIEEFATRQATVLSRETPARMDIAFASPSLLQFTGMPLLRGRFFTAADASKGSPRTAVLTEQTWRTMFGSDPSVIGSTIRVDDVVHTIIGVTPARLRFPITFGDPFEILVPLDTSDNFLPRSTMVRVKPDVTMEQARAEMDLIAARVSPKQANRATMTTALRSASDMIWFKRQIYVVAAAVGLLLLIACANVAHLLLARGAARERELSIRTAIGAGTGRLLRQLLTESTLLALIGCAIGIGLGTLGIRTLLAFRPERMGPLGNTFIDWRVVAVAAGVSLLTGLAFGVTGAVHALRQRRTGLLGSASRPGGAPARQRLRSVLVVSEMALSTVLLVGALLLVHSILKLQRVDPGFNSRDLYAMNIELPRGRYDDARTDNFALELRSRLERSTGVTGVAIASAAPPRYGFMNGILAVEGRPIAANASPFHAVNWADPNYFSLIGLSFVEGRTFSTGKAADDEIVVNVGAAKKLWPGESAIGKRIKFLSPAMPADSISWSRIVGVVADAASGDMTSDRTDLLVYFARSSIRGMSDFTAVIRTRPGTHPAEMARRVIGQMDPLLAPPTIISVQQSLFDTFAQTRFTMLLMTVFAGIAVVLSAIGLYGVIAYAVAQRTREIGIRIALGATRRDIARRIAGQGLGLAGVGLVLGLVGGVFAARLIAAMLFGVTASDPLVLASTAAVLGGVALLATLVPMRRASQVDPAIAMRAE
jgi:predicted permease